MIFDQKMYYEKSFVTRVSSTNVFENDQVSFFKLVSLGPWNDPEMTRA